MKVGFVGLGIMGRPMTLNLVKAGFTIAVWNRTSGKTSELKEAGAKVTATLASLAAGSDLIITMVNDTPDVEEVIFGGEGLLNGLSPGKTVIDMSTISPKATEDFAVRLQKLGCEMLDAPVSGGDIGARNASLTIMVGGKQNVFENCKPIFKAVGKNIFYCGGHGNGQRCKMVNQVLCGLHAVALSEAFILAEKVGLDLDVMHQVVSSGAAGSWALSNYGPRVLSGDFAPGFKLKLQQKDLRIAVETAKSLGNDFKGIELAFQLYNEAVKQGWGDFGSHALIKLYQEKSGRKN
ncbi:MAG TPA: NAD(P)-dependent oxidoreductase [bacterium]